MSLGTKIFLTGSFGGVSPFVMRIVLDLLGQNRTVRDDITGSIVLGILLMAAMGGGIAVIWKETNLQKVFYIGLGLPSLFTAAALNQTNQPSVGQRVSPPAAITEEDGGQHKPKRSPQGPSGQGVSVTGPVESLMLRALAASSIPGRHLSITLPAEISNSPLNVIFDPDDTFAPFQQKPLEVPLTATAFHLQGDLASSDWIPLAATEGAQINVKLQAKKTTFSGFLYALGIKQPPFKLTVIENEPKAPITDPHDPIVSGLNLKADAKDLGRKDAAGNERYYFTLWLEGPSAVLDQIGQAHYDLVYESNPLSVSSGPPPQFAAHYEGWGCYDRVFVIITLKAAQDQPRAKTFSMCSALGQVWR